MYAAVYACWSISALFAGNEVNIIILETMQVSVIQDFSREYAAELDKLSETTDTDYETTILNAQGNKEQAYKLLQEYCSSSKPDLIVSVATLASQAAYDYIQGTDIPLLFTTVSDPVGAGLVNEIGIPTGGKHTGIVAALPRSVQLDFAMQLARQVIADRSIHIGIVSSDYSSSIGDITMLKAAAAAYPIIFHTHIFPYRSMPEGLSEMLEDSEIGILALDDTVDFWWEVSGPLTEIEEFSELTRNLSSKPILYGNRLESVREGSLFSMVQNIENTAQEAVQKTRSILAGTSPGSIPVTPPRKFNLGLSLAKSLELNIVIPLEMMQLAGDFIYR